MNIFSFQYVLSRVEYTLQRPARIAPSVGGSAEELRAFGASLGSSSPVRVPLRKTVTPAGRYETRRTDLARPREVSAGGENSRRITTRGVIRQGLRGEFAESPFFYFAKERSHPLAARR